MRDSTMTLGSIHRRGVTSVIQAAERASQASELIETKNVPVISASQGEGSPHQVTFSEVSLPRSFAISRTCSSAASGSSTISWAMMLGTSYGKWLLRPLFF
jgi:hypothetical protein